MLTGFRKEPSCCIIVGLKCGMYYLDISVMGMRLEQV